MPLERNYSVCEFLTSEGGSVVREGFIEEVAFELDFKGLVWFKHVEMRRKGIESKGSILNRSGVGRAQYVQRRVNSLGWHKV